MRVGIFIDGYNLYYGGESLIGKRTSGWRWLDMRSLFSKIATTHWPTMTVAAPIVYCTSRIKGDPAAHKRQDDYIRALVKSSSVDVVEYGNFIAKAKVRPIGEETKTGKTRILPAVHPVFVKDAQGADSPGAYLMVSVSDREEKGSDVNVAAHLLIEALEGRIDAAIVVSNDSDLSFAVKEARRRVPVGVVNPNRKPTAAKLKKHPTDGPGGHWEYQLVASDWTAHQLSDPCAGITKPPTW